MSTSGNWDGVLVKEGIGITSRSRRSSELCLEDAEGVERAFVRILSIYFDLFTLLMCYISSVSFLHDQSNFEME